MASVELKPLVLALVRPLVKHPEAVQVTLEETARFRQLNLTVAPADVGRVIGRQGHVAAALRTLIAGSQDRHDNAKRVRLMIHDDRH